MLLPVVTVLVRYLFCTFTQVATWDEVGLVDWICGRDADLLWPYTLGIGVEMHLGLFSEMLLTREE